MSYKTIQFLVLEQYRLGKSVPHDNEEDGSKREPDYNKQGLPTA
jgi:hypothetical protein